MYVIKAAPYRRHPPPYIKPPSIQFSNLLRYWKAGRHERMGHRWKALIPFLKTVRHPPAILFVGLRFRRTSTDDSIEFYSRRFCVRVFRRFATLNADDKTCIFETAPATSKDLTRALDRAVLWNRCEQNETTPRSSFRLQSTSQGSGINIFRVFQICAMFDFTASKRSKVGHIIRFPISQAVVYCIVGR